MFHNSLIFFLLYSDFVQTSVTFLRYIITVLKKVLQVDSPSLESFFILIPGAARHRAPLKRQETYDSPYTGSGISMICRAFSNAVFQIYTHIKLLCRCMHQAPYVHFLPSYHLSARSYTHSFPEDPCLLLYFDTSLRSQALSLLKDGNV